MSADPNEALLQRLALIARTSLNRDTERDVMEAVALIRQEWSCGHTVAGAACPECYRLLAQKATTLQAEVDLLTDQLAEARTENDQLKGVHW